MNVVTTVTSEMVNVFDLRDEVTFVSISCHSASTSVEPGRRRLDAVEDSRSPRRRHGDSPTRRGGRVPSAERTSFSVLSSSTVRGLRLFVSIALASLSR
jgi:hypothetical protein